MGIFDTEFVNSIAADNEAKARAAEAERIEAQAAAARQRAIEQERGQIVDEALREFPSVAKQAGVQPFKVSYVGDGPFYLTRHTKVWPVQTFYCIDSAGHTFRMDHLGAYDRWMQEAKAGKAHVDKVDRQEVIDQLVHDAQSQSIDDFEEALRFVLARYLRI